MKPVSADRKELLSGIMFIVVGLLYGSVALRDLPLGSAVHMGPGYFPVALCVLLIGIGSVVSFRGLYKGPGEALGQIPWRGGSLLIASIAFFATFVGYLGLVPAVFVTSMLASTATRLRLRTSLATSAFLSILSLVVFIYGIGLPLRPFGMLF